jgi:hypothetical protein
MTPRPHLPLLWFAGGFGSHLITPPPQDERMVIGGPLGLFNTGTNLLCELFKSNKLPGCSFYRQKHKPPDEVLEFSYHLASTKYHRIWLHSLLEIILRRETNLTAIQSAAKIANCIIDTVDMHRKACIACDTVRQPQRLESSVASCLSIDPAHQEHGLVSITR